MQRLAVTVLVVVMMLAIGLRTAPEELRHTLRSPAVLLWTALVNIVVVPLLALALLWVSPLSQAAMVGILLCAVCPGGATSPLFVHAAGADVPRSVTAMIGLSMLSVVTAPVSLGLLLDGSVAIDIVPLVVPMMVTLGVVQLAPLVVGMVARLRWPDLAERAAGPLGLAANVLLVAVIGGLLVTKGAVLLQLGLQGAALCVALVHANLAVGGLGIQELAVRRALSLVTGVRNISLALLLSATYFPDPETDAAILTFGLFTMLLPYLQALLQGRSPLSDAAS